VFWWSGLHLDSLRAGAKSSSCILSICLSGIIEDVTAKVSLPLLCCKLSHKMLLLKSHAKCEAAGSRYEVARMILVGAAGFPEQCEKIWVSLYLSGCLHSVIELNSGLWRKEQDANDIYMIENTTLGARDSRPDS
jgi:hypothetical protein